MPIGTRLLTVLDEFKPFGLIAEALDGPPATDSSSDYSYHLFDPEVVRDSDDVVESDHDFSFSAPEPARTDHEIFIRGNRITWSIGSRVHKKYTSPNPVLKACWCRMESIGDPLLCVLQIDTLSIYSASGEIACLTLPFSVASIWPLPSGLLLQKLVDGCRPSSLSSSLLNARDLARSGKEHGTWRHSSRNFSPSEPPTKEDRASSSSHLILQHPMVEPVGTYYEDRGKLTIMKDFEESTIWTSDIVPLMVSYNKGKSQHSVWFVEATSNHDIINANSTTDAILSEFFKWQFSFRRIWQGKCSQSASSKIFIATDNDGVPVICFLIQDQMLLLAIRLLIDDAKDEVYMDIKPQLSWSISAIAAAPVIVTHPRVKVGVLSFTDIITLSPENVLLLYCGKQCLCKYLFPTGFRKMSELQGEHCPEDDVFHDLKILDVTDAVDGRINVIANTGQMFRCELCQNPSSSLSNDCMLAMAEGMNSSFYGHFVSLFWGSNWSACQSDSLVDSEWEIFSSVLMSICGSHVSNPPEKHCMPRDTSWEFLINSKFHANYCKLSTLPMRLLATDRPSGSTVSAAKAPECNQNPLLPLYTHLQREILDSLHALYETLKLDVLRKRDVGLLVVLLSNVAVSLAESSYVDYYARDFPHLLGVGKFQCTSPPTEPPCVTRWLENCLLKGCKNINLSGLPPLVRKDKCYAVSWARKIVSFYSLLLGAEKVGGKLSSGVYCEIADGSARTVEERTILAMVAAKFGCQQLDRLPVGISLPLRHALDKCRECPPTDWPAAAYVLVGREDLAMSCLGASSKAKKNDSHSNMGLISVSLSYMLHLKPVMTPSDPEVMGWDGVKSDDTDSLDGFIDDGMEHMFNSSTQLRYGRDLRMKEVRRLLCSTKPVVIQTPINPSASEQELQQHRLWNLAHRTASLPFGRGAFTLATTYTLLTEALSIPKLVLAGRLPAQQNATVNLDPNVRNISELRTWPEFNNGVAAGLRLAPFQEKMSSTWIKYNDPLGPSSTHAGFLFALGLSGHLRVLKVTDVFRYLSKEHDITILGLLLGLAVSYRGTMNPSVTKMLYLHIPSSHPSFPELELPTLLQTAALMSFGFLYEGSANPAMMKLLLDEISRRSGGDNVLEREGYALAAGYALGLLALGRSMDAIGFMESFIEQLFQFIGVKEEGHTGRSSNIAQTAIEHTRGFAQIMDGSRINVGVTAPGATVALALMFLKTESEAIASRIGIPVTHFGLQFVRPDFIMLRIIAQNLIMWCKMLPSRDWIESQLPAIVKLVFSKISEDIDSDEFDAEALFQAYVNIITGSCISLALKYAGTRNIDAQELLHHYAIYFLNEIKTISIVNDNDLPKGLLQYVDRGTIEICLHLIVLSLSVIMAGSGHLQTLRLLRYLRSRSSAEGHINYGLQMAVNMAIGFLFLGGGMQTFSTGNSAVAALLMTLYPRLPSGPNDNRCHLQAFRHLYVIASESRWVQTVDVDTGLPVYAPLEVTVKETESYAETSFCEVTPCILPERSTLKCVRVCGPRYWPQVIKLLPDDKTWWRYGDKSNPFNGGLLYIKRRTGSCSYVDDPIGCQSLLSRAIHKVFDTSYVNKNSATSATSNNGLDSYKLDQLISVFSSDPSLIAFARLCCDSSGGIRTYKGFQVFCSQVLLECVSKDRPALLQVYLYLYIMIGSLWEQVKSFHFLYHDTLFLSNIKMALAYNDALITGKLTSTRGGIIQSTFTESLRKHIDEILLSSPSLVPNFHEYLRSGRWPSETTSGSNLESLLLSCYLQWFNVPLPHALNSSVRKAKSTIPTSVSVVPLLQLLLPMTHLKAIAEIDKVLVHLG